MAALRGEDPYSAAVTREIQAQIYQHPLRAGSRLDRQAFVYPAPFILILAPLTLLSWHVVYRLGMIGALPLIALMTFSWLRISGLKVDRATRWWFIAFVVASWPAIVAAMGCQPSAYFVADIVFSLFLFRRGADKASGFLLALAAVKPQLVVLVALWLILLAFRHRRFSFPLTFALTLATMFGASLLLVPHWVPEWIRAINTYVHSGKTPLLVTLAGPMAGSALCAALLAVTGFRCRRFLLASSTSPEFSYVAALLLAATACLIPSNPWMIYNDLLLVPAVLMLLHGAAGSSRSWLMRLGRVAVLLMLLTAPLCGLLGIEDGYSVVFAVVPGLVCYWLPIVVTAAIFAANPGTDAASPPRASRPLEFPRHVLYSE